MVTLGFWATNSQEHSGSGPPTAKSTAVVELAVVFSYFLRLKGVCFFFFSRFLRISSIF